jgi:hypothetical protein
MNSVTVNEISHELESVLSDILPDLYQLLQHYQVSSPLEIVLSNLDSDLLSWGCIRCSNKAYCGNPPPTSCLKSTDTVDNLELEPDETEFSTDLAAILSTILPRLRESIEQIDKHFEVHLYLDPATANRNPLSCRLVDGIVLCSDQPQEAISA